MARNEKEAQSVRAVNLARFSLLPSLKGSILRNSIPQVFTSRLNFASGESADLMERDGGGGQVWMAKPIFLQPILR